MWDYILIHQFIASRDGEHDIDRKKKVHYRQLLVAITESCALWRDQAM